MITTYSLIFEHILGIIDERSKAKGGSIKWHDCNDKLQEVVYNYQKHTMFGDFAYKVRTLLEEEYRGDF